MSQQVQVDYEQIAIQCNSVCEVAEARLKELDELLRQSEEASSKLMTPEAKSLAESIKAERQALEENIKAVRKKADEEAKLGVVDMNDHDQRYAHREDAIRSANELQAKADALASGRIIQFRELYRGPGCQNRRKQSKNVGKCERHRYDERRSASSFKRDRGYGLTSICLYCLSKR